ncbi:MAG TPA: N-carbamoyl-L-amino acid amidohydrolase [Vicinamibacteria bacterium]
MSAHDTSPYLRQPNRLADVIAAIQVMGVYKFYKLDFSGWSDRISGSAADAEHWKGVFIDHPEFFRLDSARAKASLVWRRQHPKRYNVDTQQALSKEAYEGLADHDKTRVSRTPLTSTEISTLIQTATNLHARALEAKRETRWWASGVFGVIGVLLGALLKSC